MIPGLCTENFLKVCLNIRTYTETDGFYMSTLRTISLLVYRRLRSTTFEIGISTEARSKLSYRGCYIEGSVGVSLNTKVYREQEETNAYEVSLTIYDDEKSHPLRMIFGSNCHWNISYVWNS